MFYIERTFSHPQLLHVLTRFESLLELTSLPTERLRTEQTTDNDSIMLDLPACNLTPALGKCPTRSKRANNN